MKRLVLAATVVVAAFVVLLLLNAIPALSVRQSALERVAEAGKRTDAFYAQQVQSYRYQSYLAWGPKDETDPRDPRKRAQVTLETTVDGEVVLPGRLSMVIHTADIVGGAPTARNPLGTCQGSDVIEETLYESVLFLKQCDGSWRAISAPDGNADQMQFFREYTNKLTALQTVQRSVQ